MATNLESTIELTKLIQHQNNLYTQQSRLIQGQMVMLQQMVGMMKGVDISQTTEGFEALTEAVQEARDKMGEFGETGQAQMTRMDKLLGKNRKGFDSTTQKVKKFSKTLMGIGVAGEVLNKLVGTFSVLKTAMTGGLGIVMDLISAFGNLAVSIITLPFKMLNGLISQVQIGSGELRQAIEDIRKEFGDLRSGTSRAIMDMWRGMRGRGRLAETGLSIYRVFGNIAERLRFLTEYAQKLGAQFTNLSKGIVADAERFGAYVKGLGLTEEGMKGLGRQALIFGKTFNEIGRQVTTIAYQLGPAFGINGKEISRAMGDMMNDVRNFGSLSVKELGQVAVYVRKLGLEVKDLLGIVDKFDNFEDAAQSVAQLTQAFGLNIDAYQLMKEQDPAARFETIRKAFYATGKAVEGMTRQELKLLASQTGLSEEAVKLGFSMKNQGMTYDQVQKKASLAEKKQLTQAEAMEKLANSIERLVKVGQFGSGGFFDRFIQGFIKGVQWSREFRVMMRHIARALQTVYWHGVRVGRIFVKEFPGVKQIFKGIADLFNPRRWRKMMDQVQRVFTTFFKRIKTDPIKAVKDLLDGIKSTFLKFFGTTGGSFAKISGGFKDFFRAVIRGGAAILQEGVKKILDFMIDLFSDNSRFVTDLKRTAGNTIGGLAGFFTTEFSWLRDNIDWDGIFAGLVEICRLGFNGMKNFIGDFIRSDTGKEMIKSFNELWLKIKPPLIKAAKELGEEIALALLKGIGEAYVKYGPTAGAYFTIKGLREGFGDIEAREQIQKSQVAFTRDMLKAHKGMAAAFEQKDEAAWDNARQNALAYIQGQIERLEEQIPIAGSEAQRKGIIELIKNLKKNEEQYSTAVFQYSKKTTDIASKAVTSQEQQKAVERLVQQRERLVTETVSKTQRTTQEALAKAGRKAAGVGAEGASTEQIRNMVSSQTEAVEALQDFKKLKLLKMPSVGELKALGQKLTEFLSIWKKNLSRPLIELGVALQSFDFSVLDNLKNLAYFNILSVIKLPSADTLSKLANGLAAISSEFYKKNEGIGKNLREALYNIGTAVAGVNFDKIAELNTALSLISDMSKVSMPTQGQIKAQEVKMNKMASSWKGGLGKGITDLVNDVNVVAQELNKIGDSPRTINVRLKELANKLGVGGTTRLEVKNKNFKIDIRVNVKLDADDFEKAMLSRPGGSRFQFAANMNGGPIQFPE